MKVFKGVGLLCCHTRTGIAWSISLCTLTAAAMTYDRHLRMHIFSIFHEGFFKYFPLSHRFSLVTPALLLGMERKERAVSGA